MKKLLFDFFPVILFFIAFKLEDDPKRGIMVATAVVIVATLVQVGYMRLRHGRIEKLHLVTLVLVVALGGPHPRPRRRALHQVEAHPSSTGRSPSCSSGASSSAPDRSSGA